MLKQFFRRWPSPGWLHHRFTVSGLNLERFLNTLRKQEITLVRVCRVDLRSLECTCRSADLERIAAIAREKGWRMENAAPVGTGAWLMRLLGRPGLLAGAALACALLVFLMQFVWLVRIEGAGPYRADIAAYLQAEGIGPGMRKASMDAKRLALLLQRRYPEVAWFRAYVSNVTLTVECTQGVPAPALPSETPADLYAARDGVVQAVEVYAGTAVVKPGDAVLAGQLLIRGQERGRDGELLPVCARGRVVARCWEEATVRIPLEAAESRETGRSGAVTQLCTPWFCLPRQPETPAYLTSALYRRETPVVGCFFPLWYRVDEYREVALENVLRPVAEVKAEAEEAASLLLRQKLRGYRITRQWLEAEVSGGYVYATVKGEFPADLCIDPEGAP